jgi:sulfate permease, SulP family
MPAKYVRPYSKGQKNDFRDAEAIAEAVQRPTMKFVATKTAEQLDLQALHRVRERLVSQRTGIINQIRAFLLERGVAVRQGLRFLRAELPRILVSAHILISQLPGVLGLPSPDGPMLQRVAILAGHVNEANPITLFIGLGVLAVIAVSERINARIPGALIGLILATAAVALMGLESRGVTVLGAVFGALPTLAIPDIPAGRLASLVPLSLIIATVVMVQTAATTRSFPSDPNEPPDVDRDFVGVGAGSILSGLIGAFPVNASPPRTAIVSETSGRSQLTGLVAAAIVLALLAFGATLLRHVPQAALGGVLLFVALRIIRVRQTVAIYRQSFGEFLLIVSTTAAIIVLPIEQGVAIGIALSLLNGIWSTTRARVLVFERVPGTTVWWPPSPSS